MKPTIGRIVIYKHPGSADGKYPPQESPAIIQHVDEDIGKENVQTLGHRLWVFGPQGIFWVNAFEGTGPCQWHWPERV